MEMTMAEAATGFARAARSRFLALPKIFIRTIIVLVAIAITFLIVVVGAARSASTTENIRIGNRIHHITSRTDIIAKCKKLGIVTKQSKVQGNRSFLTTIVGKNANTDATIYLEFCVAPEKDSILVVQSTVVNPDGTYSIVRKSFDYKSKYLDWHITKDGSIQYEFSNTAKALILAVFYDTLTCENPSVQAGGDALLANLFKDGATTQKTTGTNWWDDHVSVAEFKKLPRSDTANWWETAANRVT